MRFRPQPSCNPPNALDGSTGLLYPDQRMTSHPRRDISRAASPPPVGLSLYHPISGSPQVERTDWPLIISPLRDNRPEEPHFPNSDTNDIKFPSRQITVVTDPVTALHIRTTQTTASRYVSSKQNLEQCGYGLYPR